MDANGIGTDATMAEHIAKIKERAYVMTQPRSGGGRDAQGGRGARGGRGSRGGRGGRGGGNAGGGSGSVLEFIPTTLGTALIEGYDNVGLATSLGKPFLRKEMEIKMKEICAGTKSRYDFVHETLEQYQEVFARTQQQVEVLKAVGCQKTFRALYLCTDFIHRLLGSIAFRRSENTEDDASCLQQKTLVDVMTMAKVLRTYNYSPKYSLNIMLTQHSISKDSPINHCE